MEPVWRRPRYGPPVTEPHPTVPATIVCVDCGGTCDRLSFEPHEGFAPGDVVAYRCRDCYDRWDIELTADDLS